MEIMKRIFLNLLMLVCSMSMFTACSDNDEPNIPIEKELVGTYKGTLDIAMNGSNLANGLPKNVTITKAGVSTINLELKDFSFMGQNLGNIVIADCEILKYRDHYAISGNQALTLPSIGECTVVASGTLIGHDITVGLEIAVAALKQTVKVIFEGAKLAGNESSEAKITSFTIDSEVVTSQPIIDETGKTITFKVGEEVTPEVLRELIPVFEISPKAVVSPASGVKQNFNEPVEYTVIAEDGTSVKYTVSILAKEGIYDFENWVEDQTYHFFTPEGMFGTTNGGSSLVYSSLEGVKEEQAKNGIEIAMPSYCVVPTEDVSVGKKAAHLETISLVQAKADLKKYGGFIGGLMSSMCPNITAGSAFLGSFKLDDLLKPLTATKFGVLSTSGKPVNFSGWYKYTPGPIFYDAKNNVLDETDQCAIYAILYEAKDASGNDITLNGETVNAQDAPIVYRADVESGTATNGWKKFDIDFKTVNGRVYEKNKEYKLAFIATSSKRGDSYEGAPGSVLVIDDFRIDFE